MKYIDMVFELADGTEKHAYIPCKDLFDPYQGYQAIRIEYDASVRMNTVKLIINDPSSNGALTQDDAGLRIWDASETQFGVVKYSTQDEVRAAAATTNKTVKPYNLYDFAVNSPSVDDSLENIWTDPDTSKHHNQTIIKAINEVASTRVTKQTTPDTDDVATYKVVTYPKGNTATPLVTNQLGETIHINKQVIQVPSLIGVVSPKDYIIYYLQNIEGANHPGLYMYVEGVWKKVSDVAILQVASLPTTNIRYDVIYGLISQKQSIARYKVTDTAKQNGYRAGIDGITWKTTLYTWDVVEANLAQWIGEGKLAVDTAGIIYRVQDGATSTTTLVYDYMQCNEDLYYYYDNTWFSVSNAPISIDFINDLFIVD